jgi:uncharacterized protein (TIGR02118 family)
MINVSVLYPRSDDAKFDLDYYLASHVAMVRERFGALCKRIEVNVGLNHPLSGDAPAYIAVAHMYFESPQDFSAAFGPHADEIMGDIKNYTNIEPIVHFSEVR